MSFSNKDQELWDLCDNLAIEHDRLDELAKSQSLNTEGKGIRFFGKIVLKDQENQYIYRVDTKWDTMRRVKMRELALANGIEIFMPEEVISDNNLFCKTKQLIIDPWDPSTEHYIVPEKLLDHYVPGDINFKLSARAAHDYSNYNDIVKLFEYYSLGGLTEDNVGVYEGKIKIFDYFGNYTVDNQGELYPNEFTLD